MPESAFGRNKVEMFVRGRSIQALLDTGSWLSIVSLKFVRSLRIPMKSTPEDQCILKSAGGNFLNVCGKVNLDLSINHLSMSHEFVIVENLTLIVLIGCDFMYMFNHIRRKVDDVIKIDLTISIDGMLFSC